MRAHVHLINNIDSSDNLPCYPPDSHYYQNAVYWRTGGVIGGDRRADVSYAWTLH